MKPQRRQADIKFNPRTGRYYNAATGRFIAFEKVTSYSFQSVNTSSLISDQLAASVSSGGIDTLVWRRMFQQELKEEYIRQYVLGRGGLGQMAQADWGRLGSMLKEQYKYLNGFEQAIADGTLSEAQIADRAGMYINSSREAYERARGKVMEVAELDEVLWEVNPALENCESCLAFQAMGWQLVADNPFGGCVPGSGCTKCLTKCGCGLRYRKGKKR